jgi:hypothetical protein
MTQLWARIDGISKLAVSVDLDPAMHGIFWRGQPASFLHIAEIDLRLPLRAVGRRRRGFYGNILYVIGTIIFPNLRYGR